MLACVSSSRVLQRQQGLLSACLKGSRSPSHCLRNPHTRASQHTQNGEKHQVAAKFSTSAISCSLPGEQKTPKEQSGVEEGQKLPGQEEWALAQGSAFQSLQTLSEWVTEKQVDFHNDIKNSNDFTQLIKKIEDTTPHITSAACLLRGLKSLKSLGVESDSYVVQSVGTQLLWELRKASYPMLVSVIIYQQHHQHTALEKKILKEAISAVQRRWVEINGVTEVELLYNHNKLFSADFLGHLDDKTIELAADMNCVELQAVFCTLAQIRRRATPVIRALAFHIAKQSESLSPKHISNMLFAMKTLNFSDPVLLERLAKDLIPQVEEIDKPNLITNILYCMGQLKWRQPILLEALCEWTEKNIPTCLLNNFTTLIMTLATVSYTPANVDTLFQLITPQLNSSAVPKHTAWLDTVWSLVVLGKATPQQVASVLDSTFISSLPLIDQNAKMGLKLKLLNINSVAHLELPSYSGPYLDLTDFKDAIITKGRGELMLSKHIQKMLCNILPPPRYMRESIQTSMGTHVDFELLVDKNGKPLPLLDHSSAFGQAENIPTGAVKAVILIWNYKDYTVGSQELTGINNLALRLLKKMGYSTVQIPYYDYNMKSKTLKCVQYLEGKVKELVEL